jgi:hypothetical protein
VPVVGFFPFGVVLVVDVLPRFLRRNTYGE